MNKTNQHRVGKHAMQCYLTSSELDLVNKAKVKAKVKTNRELILALSSEFLAKP